MPVNILEKSKTWRNYADKRTIPTRRIIAYIAPYLDNDYEFSKSRTAVQLLPELKNKGIAKKKAELLYAGTIIRSAYKYISNKDKESVQKMLDNNDRAVRGLRCLLKDGLDTMEKILTEPDSPDELTIDKIEKSLPKSKQQPIETSPPRAVSLEESLIKFDTLDQEPIAQESPIEQPTESVISPPYLQELFTRIINDVTELGVALVHQNEEMQQLLHENARIYESVAQENLEKANKQFVKEQDHLKALEGIVAAFPNIPELYKLKEKIKQYVQPTIQQRLVVPSEFPRIMISEGNARMMYKNSFLDNFYSMPRIEQMAVTDSLNKLAKYGRSYPSLQSKILTRYDDGNSLAQTPVGAIYSRGSQNVRFTWHREDKDIWFFNVCMKQGVK